jgi:hypothetical protein
MRVALLHAPDGIEVTLGALPDRVRLQHGLRRGQRVDVKVCAIDATLSGLRLVLRKEFRRSVHEPR